MNVTTKIWFKSWKHQEKASPGPPVRARGFQKQCRPARWRAASSTTSPWQTKMFDDLKAIAGKYYPSNAIRRLYQPFGIRRTADRLSERATWDASERIDCHRFWKQKRIQGAEQQTEYILNWLTNRKKETRGTITCFAPSKMFHFPGWEFKISLPSLPSYSGLLVNPTCNTNLQILNVQVLKLSSTDARPDMNHKIRAHALASSIREPPNYEK